MARTQYDIAIIGGGSGGLTAARVATNLGANVLLIDKERLGGDCLNYGCVPSKSLIHVARVVQQAREAMQLGLTPANLGVDMARVSAYVQGVISRVQEAEKVYAEGATIKFGAVSFKSPTELVLNDEEITSRSIVIATGSRPAIPAIEGLQEVGYFTNEDVFDLTALPSSLAIIGGGPISVELGQAFERLGTKVTIIQRAERILPKEDPEVSATIVTVLQSEGIDIATETQVLKASRQGQKKVITVKQGTRVWNIEADEILLAVGRHPNVEGLNLAEAGIAYDSKGIKVDDYLQTSAPNVLAIGDVIGGYFFTHVAAYQAGIAVRNAVLPVGKKKVDYRVVPWCTFTDPEAARVGFTPQEAEQQYKQTRVVKLPWADIDRAQTENETTGFIKLVLAGKKDEIVGAHMVGAHAGELLGEMSLAMQHNLTINDIFNTIHAYPTMNTGVQQAAFEAYLESTGAVNNRRFVRTVLNLRG
ncbi:MAG TPA: FAD-dependent oxidoreductase [Ktedonosporobacter sp.]|jgi:dihydrolipoamide dehydrogenase|nr:FAD-dependent oxidoreductase [Ktedonosporobacter sp.]